MKILIVAPAWLGDMVMSHALVQVLLARHPGVVIDLLAPPATAPLGERLPGVRAVHLLNAGHGDLALGQRWRTGRNLAEEEYDQAIVLPNSFKSALVPLWAGIRKRTGWTGESRFGLLNDRRTLETDNYPLMIERFMALGLDDGLLLDKPYPRPQLKADDANCLEMQLSLCVPALSLVQPNAGLPSTMPPWRERWWPKGARSGCWVRWLIAWSAPKLNRWCPKVSSTWPEERRCLMLWTCCRLRVRWSATTQV